MTLLVEIYGAPGSGKTTLCHQLQAYFSINHPNLIVEMIPECAKPYVYEGAQNPFIYQEILVGEQSRFLHAYKGKADIILTDAPLEISCLYATGDYPECFYDFLRWSSSRFKRITILTQNTRSYIQDGRRENEERSKELHKKMEAYLEHYHPNSLRTSLPNQQDIEEIAQKILEKTIRKDQ